MKIFATALLISATAAAADGPDIAPGRVGEFFDFPGATTSDTALGSFSSYVSTNAVRIPNMWRIVREGVVTNVPAPTFEDTPDGFRFFVGDSHAPGETISYPYSQTFDNPDPIFDLGWTTQFGSTNVGYRAHGTNFINKSLGKDVYRLRPKRTNLESYSDLVATFEAYYERLYYASQGQSNVWDQAKWGPTNKCPEFKVGITNINGLSVYRHFDYINLPCFRTNKVYVTMSTNVGRRIDTARLQEFPNVYGIREDLKKVLGPDYLISGALLRPGWLTFGTLKYWEFENVWTGDFNPNFWWSSTRLFPGNEDSIVVPEFDWRNFVVSPTNSQEWSDHAATFEMMDYSEFGFPSGGKSPLSKLVRQSAYHGYEDKIPQRDFSGITIPDAITNVFWNSARSRIFNEPWTTYSRTWQDPPSGHLLRPEPVAGMNQLLSMMDRTIHMPLISKSVSYDNVRAMKTFSITGWAGIEVSSTFNPYDGHYDGIATDFLIENWSSTSTVTRTGLYDFNQAVLAVSGTQLNNPDFDGSNFYSEFIIDADTCKNAIDDLSDKFTNGFNFVTVHASIFGNDLELAFVTDGGSLSQQYYPIDDPHGYFYVYSLSMPSTYYEYTEYKDFKVTSGPFQPGVDASESDRVKRSHFGALSTIMTTDSKINSSYWYDSYNNFHGWSFYNQIETPEIFNSAVYNYDEKDFENRLSYCMFQILKKEKDMFREMFGKDYNDHEGLILDPPLPSADSEWNARVLLKAVPDDFYVIVFAEDDIALFYGVSKSRDRRTWSSSMSMEIIMEAGIQYNGSPICSRPDFCARGDFSAITQVDWEWKNMSIKEKRKTK